MNRALLLKAVIAWLLILSLAIANGALRETVLIPSLGKSAGLVLSGVLLCLLVLLVAYGFVRFLRVVSVSQGLIIGFFWVLLTLAFEFGFGRYVQHKPWSELWDAYTFSEGNIWPVVLLAILVTPSLTVWLQGRVKR